MLDDEAEIVPVPGRELETLRLLLELADKPRHVRISHEGGRSYLVPISLRDRFVEASKGAPLESAPKRRGRPPKARPAPINSGLGESA